MPCSTILSRRPHPAICITVIALSMLAPAFAAGDPAPQEWMPLEVGRSWVYVDEIGEELTIRVAGRAEEIEVGASRDCYHVTWNDDLLGPAYQAEIWCREGSDVVLAGKELSGSRLPMSGAAVLLREPLRQGMEWDSTFSLGDEELSARGVVVGNETIDTPAGSFETVHVRIEQPSGDVDRWYARGVGIVQEHTSLFGRSLGRKKLAEHVGTQAPETVALFDAPAEPLQPQRRESAIADPQPPMEPTSASLDDGITSDSLTDDSDPLFPEESDGDLARFGTAEGDGVEESSFRGGTGVSSHPEFAIGGKETSSSPEPFEVAEAEAPLAEEPEPVEPTAEDSSSLVEEEPVAEEEWAADDAAETSWEEAAITEEVGATPATYETSSEPQQNGPPTAEECETVGTYVVMVGGERVDTPEGWELDGRRVLYRNHAGSLLALRTSSVDFDETERRQSAECAAQAERERVKPPPPPRNWLEAAQRRTDDAVAMELADSDLEPGARKPGGATAEYVLRQLGVDTTVLTGLADSGELAALATVLTQQQADLQARLSPYRDRVTEGDSMSSAVADEVMATAKQLSQLAASEERSGLRAAYQEIGNALQQTARRMRSDPLEATRMLAMLSG